jgi:hypothetical protein
LTWIDWIRSWGTASVLSRSVRSLPKFAAPTPRQASGDELKARSGLYAPQWRMDRPAASRPSRRVAGYEAGSAGKRERV